MINMETVISAAAGRQKADTLFVNAKVVNVFTGEIIEQSVAVKDGYICGFGNSSAKYEFEAGQKYKESKGSLKQCKCTSERRGSNQDYYDALEIVDLQGMYIAPGFIDAHVHIESSMVTPAQFARGVVVHGTTTIIADPHEIANVMGIEGVDYMIRSAHGQPVNILFAMPSCVPATSMETSGAILDASSIFPLLNHDRIVALAEMMNYPGVIFTDPDVMAKLKAAGKAGKTVDGHAPGVTGRDLCAYAAAGIYSDHECTTAKEALEKMRLGIHIMVRQGTCAKNLDAVLPAINDHTWQQMMWCTDDRHPHEILAQGHVDQIVRRAIQSGLDPVRAIQMATINCARYFGIRDVGAIAPGRRADMVVFKDLHKLIIEKVFVKGVLVAQDGVLNQDIAISSRTEKAPKIMNIDLNRVDFSIPCPDKNSKVWVIKIIPDQVVTEGVVMDVPERDGLAVCDTDRDILKIAVIERYSGKTGMSTGFVTGLGLLKGAIASTVAHDSHNIIVAGTNDEDMVCAVKSLQQMGGGFAVACRKEVLASLALPVAGLMSIESLEQVNDSMDKVIRAAKSLGSQLPDPFMTLGFLALPVIPSLKITDKGLVDVEKFEIVGLFA
ncbi:MAG: adenine deaminase [Desulfamplus sp.]|nr:adenine deaminase [Desulfamplus sp.]